MPVYNNQELIDDIVNRIFIPLAQPTFSDASLMRHANSALQDEVVPAIISVRNEYFVKHVDGDPVDGIIAIDPRAVGMKLRMVAVVDGNNNVSNLPEITLDQLAGWGNGWGYYGNSYGGGYNIQDNNIHLVPTNMTVNGQIRQYFFNPPLVLTDPVNYGKVTAVDTGTNTVTLDNVPEGFTAGYQVNTVKGQPDFSTTLVLAEVVTVTNLDVELTDVTGISVGDYISEYGTSAVAQIPVVFRGWLAQLTGAKCLEGLGDKEGMKIALEKAETLKQNALTTIVQRVDSSPKKIMHMDGGLVGNVGFGGWGGFNGGRRR